MLTVTILEKTYHVAKHSSAKALGFILNKELEDLDVKILKIEFSKDKYSEITLEGEDEEIAKNFLITKYGTQKSVSDIKVGDQLIGRLKNVGEVKFGFFVDAGLKTSTQKIDALYPLFEARNQLVDKRKAPLVGIQRAYGFIDNLPLTFEITKKEILSKKIWVKLSDATVKWLKEPIKEKKEALILCGSTRRMIKQSLIRSRHTEDIEVVERLGLLEYRLICKRGTRAEGMIPEIGPYLGRTKMGALVLSRIKNLHNYELVEDGD
ncbi:MAG: DUF2110 family protein [Candidatus Heimdallarchaeaceae archaeon]|jgi:hypothetical protein